MERGIFPTMRRAVVSARFVIWCIVCSIASARAAEEPAPRGDLRPDEWAQPLAVPGLPNLHAVSPILFRAAQPSADGFRELAKLGVKSVLSLRAFHGDRDALDGTGLRYQRIPFHTWHAEDEDVVAFLRFVNDPANQPVLVHCLHGADRTGTMCAIQRIVVEGWTVDRAVDEMIDGGFGFHAVWDNLPAYLRSLDVERLRREAGLDAPVEAAP